MPRLGIVVSALIAGGVIGLIFKAIYPDVPMSPELAFLFALAGLCLTMGLRLLWQPSKDKQE